MQANRVKKRIHWTKKYLKRINSTEITLKRPKLNKSNTIPITGNLIEIVPIFKSFKQNEELEKIERTPERVVHTPKREIVYISPNKNITILQTPQGGAEENENELMPETRQRCRKRLFL